jgi:hypothetical protein
MPDPTFFAPLAGIRNGSPFSWFGQPLIQNYSSPSLPFKIQWKSPSLTHRRWWMSCLPHISCSSSGNEEWSSFLLVWAATNAESAPPPPSPSKFSRNRPVSLIGGDGCDVWPLLFSISCRLLFCDPYLTNGHSFSWFGQPLIQTLLHPLPPLGLHRPTFHMAKSTFEFVPIRRPYIIGMYSSYFLIWALQSLPPLSWHCPVALLNDDGCDVRPHVPC